MLRREKLLAPELSDDLKKREVTSLIFIAVAASVLLLTGWRLFWFLSDDAFISFRYVSNSIADHGYVWNPPPFEPVEGYTNFLWVVLLDLVWRISDVTPPRAANVLSLIFSAITLVLAGLMIWRIEWAEHLRKHRTTCLGLALLGVLTNRTFLAWTSSGLETAMFVAFVLLWISCALRLHSTRKQRTGALMSLAAALAALTRPDGLLFCIATICIWLFVCRTCRWKFMGTKLLPLAPLGLVIVHLLWRRWFYHDWLPNTYYAKFSGMWPESGVRYALSFVLEYAIWFWLVVILWAGIRQVTCRSTRISSSPATQRSEKRSAFHSLIFGRAGDASDILLKRGVGMLAIGALLLQAGYYVFAVGGDHFEYRIFSHFIVLLWVSLVWALNYLKVSSRAMIGIVVVFLALSLPLPWTHWAISRKLETRVETYQMRIPVAPHWPKGVRWYAHMFDQLQSWLISHLVCCRHQEHKIAYTWWADTQIPTREEGKKLPSEGHPVMTAHGGIGALGWVFPTINLIDLHGLNDYVIARSPARPEEVRLMAHDRVAPAAYVNAFRPNVDDSENPGTIVVRPRQKPLSASEIEAIEREWRQRVRRRGR